MFIVGLTGGIGSGKTTVANLFAELGTPLIDTDLIARELVEPGMSAYEQIVQTFGEAILNKNSELDRSALRELVFADTTKRQQLEAILHPLIRETVKSRISRLDHTYCIVVIPLLAEKGGYNFLDRVLVVDSPREQQIQRVLKRDKISPESLQKILSSQADRASRLAIADDCIENTGAESDLKYKVKQLHERYMELAAEK